MSYHPSERFDFDRFYDPPPADAEIVKRLKTFEMKISKDGDGDVYGTWSIGGTISNFASEEDEEVMRGKAAEELDFLALLLDAFRRAKPEQEGGHT
jgi:hypothetical protein